MKLKILTPQYFEAYKERQLYTLQKHFGKLKKKDLNAENFDFYLSSSAVYSSLIEGSGLSMESYWRYRESNINTRSKPYIEIQDLIKAYEFAQNLPINARNLLKIHKILSRTLLSGDKKYQGKLRDKSVGVYEEGKRLVYRAASVEVLKADFDKLIFDIQLLIKKDLSIDESFYYASMIHLRFSQIHPFADGNGRTSRLLEKWFLARKLGSKAWFIESEKCYQKSLKKYYLNINLGQTYETINQDACIPFLLMLPEALKFSR